MFEREKRERERENEREGESVCMCEGGTVNWQISCASMYE